MEHLRFDLGNVLRGSTVIISLKNQANVQLLTTRDYSNYKSGRQYRYHGGHVTKSPFRVTVPSSGHWLVAIDLGGYTGRISASVTVQPPPRGFLPRVRPVPDNPASRVMVRHDPVEPEGELFGGQTWDVFISYAHEDRDAVARPLRQALVSRGVTTWLDEAELKIGLSLRRSIDNGIRSSRFGVVILSDAFLDKGWTNHELDGLITRTVAGEQSLLPIWHGLSVEQVRSYSPPLADRVAMSTTQCSIDDIAAQIAEVVNPPT